MGHNPLSPNGDQCQEPINFLLPISLHCQEIRLWELIKWSLKRKCLDLLSNSLNTFSRKIYGDQSGEFVCVYWGLKGSTKRGVNLETELLTRPFSARKYTPATPWPVDPSFMYLLWTVLQFPANSYHMCVVQLVLKGLLSTTRLCY